LILIGAPAQSGEEIAFVDNETCENAGRYATAEININKKLK